MAGGRWFPYLLWISALTVVTCGDGGQSGGGSVNGTNGTPGADDGTADVTPTGNTLFARRYGDEGQQSLGGAAVDDDGNTYVVGIESQNRPFVSSGPEGRVFGPPQGEANGSFAVKFSPAGENLWRQPFPHAGDSTVRLMDVVVQPTTGAVILAGWLRGSITLDDGTTLTSANNTRYGDPIPEQNLVVIALDGAGYLVWKRLYPSPAFVEPQRVFVAANGDIEVVGNAADGATVGGAPLCCHDSPFGSATFMARYSPTGEPIWSTSIGGSGFTLKDADADAAGGLVVGGGLVGTMTFDGQTFSGGGDIVEQGLLFAAGVALRTDGQGHLRWARVYQGPDQSTAFLGVALDASENVVLYGTFEGTLDLGDQITLEHSGENVLQHAGLLAKLDPGGAALWAHAFPATGFDSVDANAADTDAAGNIVLAGRMAGGLSLGGPPTVPVGAGFIGTFVAKFDPSGTWLWDRGFAVETSNDASFRTGLGIDRAGRTSMAGEFDNTVDFGTGPLTAPGQPTTGGSAPPLVPDDIYVLKLAP